MIQLYKFNGKEFTIILINGDPHWIAKEVCDQFELKNVTKAIQSLKEGSQKVFIPADSLPNLKLGYSAPNGLNLLTEAGLYKIIFKSRKPEAEKFGDWVSEKVLPEIRRTGSFNASLEISEAPRGKSLEMAKMMLAAIEEQGHEIFEIKQEVHELKARSITAPLDYFTIAGYATILKFPVDVKIAATLGKKAMAICRNLGYVTGEMPDPRFGKVRTYPKEVLKTVFEDYRNNKAA